MKNKKSNMDENTNINKDLNMDEERLMDELGSAIGYLVICPTKDDIKYDLGYIESLNCALALLSGVMYDINEIYGMNPKLKELKEKSNFKEREQFLDFIRQNRDILSEITKNFLNTLTENNYVNMQYYNCIRNYSVADFRQLILDFYSRFDEKIYNMVKTYFDEERIQLGCYEYEDICSAFFASLKLLGSGYIFGVSSKYDSYNASCIVHELGHAIDAENFIFPQQKKMGVYSDPLVEVPSTCFENIFLDYLDNNYIDKTGSLIMKNNNLNFMKNTAKDMQKALTVPQFLIDPEGNAIVDGYAFNIRDAVIYGLGYYFSYHLKEIEKQDPKEFLKIFNNLISSRNESTLCESIETLGISVPDFVSGKYINDGIKDDTLKLKKRFNYHV